MFNRSLIRTTTFRLTGAFCAMFAVAILLLLGLIYLQTSALLTRRVDHILAAEAAALDRSSPEMILSVIRGEAARDPLSSFALRSSKGDFIAGDPRLQASTIVPDGAPRDLPARGRQPPLRALAERLPWGEVLVVGRDTSQVVEFKTIILNALLWSGAVITVLGLLLATILSLGPLRRVRAIQSASQAIAGGYLAMRLPIHGSRDEIDELARMVNVMMDEVERLVTQARTVGEGIAHELRTPMTRLRATLEHLVTTFDAEDFRRGMVETCVSETDSVLARFRALLRIAAVESRARQSAVEFISLSALVEQVVELYEPLALDKGVRFQSTIAVDIGIHADPALLVEALSNMIDNAIKFTPADGLVRVSLRETAEGPAVEVRDTGIGIAAADRALVTKRFYRSQDAARYPGHGLGLSLVAAVAELHGFDVSIDDAQPGALITLLCRRAPDSAVATVIRPPSWVGRSQ